MADEKRSRGRPRKNPVDVAFTLDATQAAFFLDMSRRLGWGDTIHTACKRLVVTKISEFQEASFKAHPWPLPG